MRYCSEDAPRTGERNVNFNKTTSENAVLNKMCKPDERAPSFIFKQIEGNFIVVRNRVPGFNTLVKERLLQLRTFHKCESKHE